jgi:zinc transporter
MSDSGLICAYLLDGTGSGREVGWDEVRSWKPDTGLIWVHLDRTNEMAQRWLNSAGLDSLLCQALLAEETRPRSLAVNDGLLAILRGVNLNPGADPEDMVSLRIWLEAGRVITLRQWRLMAIQDIRSDIAARTGPKDAGDFLVAVADHLIERMAPTINALEEEIDRLEIEVMDTLNHDVRSRLAGLRRDAISLRRYIAPQREAMSRLLGERTSWLNDRHRARLREVADRVTRYVEDLDAARERAAVTQEELASRVAAQMNQTMYVLSMVAVVFLPLGLLTGLLGINVAGIPGEKNQWAFLIVCLVLVVIVVLEILFFRRKHWL